MAFDECFENVAFSTRNLPNDPMNLRLACTALCLTLLAFSTATSTVCAQSPVGWRKGFPTPGKQRETPPPFETAPLKVDPVGSRVVTISPDLAEGLRLYQEFLEADRQWCAKALEVAKQLEKEAAGEKQDTGETGISAFSRRTKFYTVVAYGGIDDPLKHHLLVSFHPSVRERMPARPRCDLPPKTDLGLVFRFTNISDQPLELPKFGPAMCMKHEFQWSGEGIESFKHVRRLVGPAVYCRYYTTIQPGETFVVRLQHSTRVEGWYQVYDSLTKPGTVELRPTVTFTTQDGRKIVLEVPPIQIEVRQAAG